jgi:hypothetical protein
MATHIPTVPNGTPLAPVLDDQQNIQLVEALQEV